MPSYMHKLKDKNHAREVRNKDRAKNYSVSLKYARNGHSRYSEWEEELILDHSITDRELAILIGRSVESIQIKRVYLNKKRPRPSQGVGMAVQE